MTQTGRNLVIIACGAGPASDVGKLVKLAQERSWTVRLVATPAAPPFLNLAELEAMTGSPVRSEYRAPGEPRSPKADAVIVAPATFNTICKCALGISDTYALGILAETISLPAPVVFLPFVNTAFAARQPFQKSVAQLRDEGALILLGPGTFEPHEPGTGGNHLDAFPWHAALDAVDQAAPPVK
jgi:phosphopantothenoylcysteine synthetase/decarboxylase